MGKKKEKPAKVKKAAEKGKSGKSSSAANSADNSDADEALDAAAGAAEDDDGLLDDCSDPEDDAAGADDGASGSCKHAAKMLRPAGIRAELKNLPKLVESARKHDKQKSKSKGSDSSSSAQLWFCGTCGESDSKPSHFSKKHAVGCDLIAMTWHCFQCNMDVDESSVDSRGAGKLKQVVALIEKTLGSAAKKGAAASSASARAAVRAAAADDADSSPSLAAASVISGVAVRGLRNLGNTCFMNSVLQCLASTVPLYGTLLFPSSRFFVANAITPSQPLQGALLGFLQSMAAAPKSAAPVALDKRGRPVSKGGDSSSVFSPGGILSVIQGLNPMFRGSRQHDAHELLRLILNGTTMEKEAEVQKLRQAAAFSIIKTWSKEHVLAWAGSWPLSAAGGEAVATNLWTDSEHAWDGPFVLWLLDKWEGKPAKKPRQRLHASVTTTEDKRTIMRQLSRLKDGLLPDQKIFSELNRSKGSADDSSSSGDAAAAADDAPVPLHPFESLLRSTFVHSVFGGVARNSVECLECHTVSVTHEYFLDLSLAIEAPRVRAAAPAAASAAVKRPSAEPSAATIALSKNKLKHMTKAQRKVFNRAHKRANAKVTKDGEEEDDDDADDADDAAEESKEEPKEGDAKDAADTKAATADAEAKSDSAAAASPADAAAATPSADSNGAPAAAVAAAPASAPDSAKLAVIRSWTKSDVLAWVDSWGLTDQATLHANLRDDAVHAWDGAFLVSVLQNWNASKKPRVVLHAGITLDTDKTIIAIQLTKMKVAVCKDEPLAIDSLIEEVEKLSIAAKAAAAVSAAAVSAAAAPVAAPVDTSTAASVAAEPAAVAPVAASASSTSAPPAASASASVTSSATAASPSSSSSTPSAAGQFYQLMRARKMGFDRLSNTRATIQDCLGAFTDADLLTGNNRYGCRECSRRAQAAGIPIVAEPEPEPVPEPVVEAAEESLAPVAEDAPAEAATETDAASPSAAAAAAESADSADASASSPSGDAAVAPAESASSPSDVAAAAADERKSPEPVAVDESMVVEPEPLPPPAPVLVKQDAIKRCQILIPPTVLTLHLKRFHAVGRGLEKSSKNVDFPLCFNLRDFMTAPIPASEVQPFSSSLTAAEAPADCWYHLYGIVSHGGGMGGGHYVSYCRKQNIAEVCEHDASAAPHSHVECQMDALDLTRGWHYMSDSDVRPVSAQEVLKVQGYILFYQKC